MNYIRHIPPVKEQKKNGTRTVKEQKRNGTEERIHESLIKIFDFKPRSKTDRILYPTFFELLSAKKNYIGKRSRHYIIDDKIMDLLHKAVSKRPKIFFLMYKFWCKRCHKKIMCCRRRDPEVYSYRHPSRKWIHYTLQNGNTGMTREDGPTRIPPLWTGSKYGHC